jgi:hypothetical protein
MYTNMIANAKYVTLFQVQLAHREKKVTYSHPFMFGIQEEFGDTTGVICIRIS